MPNTWEFMRISALLASEEKGRCKMPALAGVAGDGILQERRLNDLPPLLTKFSIFMSVVLN